MSFPQNSSNFLPHQSSRQFEQLVQLLARLVSQMVDNSDYAPDLQEIETVEKVH
jgi:hypothetical protein